MFGEVRLEFDRVGAGLRRAIHQFRRQRRVAVVVDAGLGDDEARRARTDVATPDGQMCGHVDFTLTASTAVSWKRFCV